MWKGRAAGRVRLFVGNRGSGRVNVSAGRVRSKKSDPWTTLGQGRAGHAGHAGQGRAGQGMTGSGQDTTRQGMAWEGMAGHGRAEQDYTEVL